MRGREIGPGFRERNRPDEFAPRGGPPGAPFATNPEDFPVRKFVGVFCALFLFGAAFQVIRMHAAIAKSAG